jgi:hypothetical protein
LDAGWLARKGTITRHPLDFFIERAGQGFGHHVVGVGGNFGFSALYSNDPLGRALRVYTISPYSTFAFVFRLTLVSGTLGSLFMHGTPMVSNMGSPPGDIYAGEAAAVSGKDLYATSSVSAITAVSPVPILVLEQGSSLVVWSTVANDETYIGFQWMID